MAWLTDPFPAAGLIPEGSVAPQKKVSTFSFVAHRLVEELLAVLPILVLQQAPRKLDRMNDQMRCAELLRLVCGLLVGLHTGS